LISSAKLLRRSTNDVVRNNIFIKPYTTRAEAAAAFLLHEQMCLSRLRRADLNIRVSTAAAEDGLSHVAQLPANVSDCIKHGGVSLQGHAACDRNREALNPKANSFTPQEVVSDRLPIMCPLDASQQQ
jgi:hypothetical protein